MESDSSLLGISFSPDGAGWGWGERVKPTLHPSQPTLGCLPASILEDSVSPEAGWLCRMEENAEGQPGLTAPFYFTLNLRILSVKLLVG